jgi:hypothetical protein
MAQKIPFNIYKLYILRGQIFWSPRSSSRNSRIARSALTWACPPQTVNATPNSNWPEFDIPNHAIDLLDFRRQDMRQRWLALYFLLHNSIRLQGCTSPITCSISVWTPSTISIFIMRLWEFRRNYLIPVDIILTIAACKENHNVPSNWNCIDTSVTLSVLKPS